MDNPDLLDNLERLEQRVNADLVVHLDQTVYKVPLDKLVHLVRKERRAHRESKVPTASRVQLDLKVLVVHLVLKAYKDRLAQREILVPTDQKVIKDTLECKDCRVHPENPETLDWLVLLAHLAQGETLVHEVHLVCLETTEKTVLLARMVFEVNRVSLVCPVWMVAQAHLVHLDRPVRLHLSCLHLAVAQRDPATVLPMTKHSASILLTMK